MMYDINLSSNSDSEDENFEGHYKKVTYEGNLSESEHQDSQQEDSNSEISRKVKMQCRITSNKSSDAFGKSKLIKKNCESAKMSRQRKKLYLDLLEQKAEELKTNITARKNNIKNISAKIMQKFQRSNQEKYSYLTQKLALSKKLIAMTNEIQQIKKSQEEDPCSNYINPQDQNQMIPEISFPVNAAPNETQQKGKSKKKKGKQKYDEGQAQKQESCKKELQQKMTAKTDSLLLGISAYMYEFGVRGSLRTDIAERTKCEWFENVHKSAAHLSGSSIMQGTIRMKRLLSMLQEKAKKMDFCLRELKKRVKQRFVVQFLLDRQFFIHHSADTIYKNSQLTSQHS